MNRLTILKSALYDGLQDRKKSISGGPEDGVVYVTAKDIDDVFTATDDPPIDEHQAEVATPASVLVIAKCHICGQTAEVTIDIESKTLVDDKRRIISAKLDASTAIHVCGQISMRDAAAPEGMFDLPGDTTAPTGHLFQPGDDPAVCFICLAPLAEHIAPEGSQDALGADAEPETGVESTEGPSEAPRRSRRPRRRSSSEPSENPDLGACPFPGCTLVAEHPGEHNAPLTDPGPEADLLPDEPNAGFPPDET